MTAMDFLIRKHYEFHLLLNYSHDAWAYNREHYPEIGNNRLHLALMLRMHGAIPSLPHTSSYYGAN